MLDTQIPVRFFMGANTPDGFVSFPDDDYDIQEGWRVYLLKGGAGEEKNRLLRRAAEAVAAEEAEAVFCAADPDSLDGLLFPARRVGILDADAPHVREARCPGAVEQLVNLGGCLDAERLRPHMRELLAMSVDLAALGARGRRFLTAAAGLLTDSRRAAAECTDAVKIERSAARIAAREFGSRSGEPGRERRRFLSAVTPEGLVVFHETLQALCPRIYSLEDEQGASSRVLLEELRRRALESGHDIISCPCPLFPFGPPEHLLVPALGLGFTTSNPWHKADFPVYRRIHAARFTDAERLRKRRQLLSFNRRAARELIREAVQLASDARTLRRRVAEIYAGAVKQEEAARMTEQLLSELCPVLETPAGEA